MSPVNRLDPGPRIRKKGRRPVGPLAPQSRPPRMAADRLALSPQSHASTQEPAATRMPLASLPSAFAMASAATPGTHRAEASAGELLPDLDAQPADTTEEVARTVVAKPELTSKVIAGATAAVTMADRVSASTGTAAPPGARAEGIVGAVLPVAGAIAEATGNKTAAKQIEKSQDAAAVAFKLRDAGLHLNQAATAAQSAAQTVRDGASAATSAAQAAGTASHASSAAAGAATTSTPAGAMSGLGRTVAGLDIARGVLLAPQLARQVKTLAEDPRALKNPDFVKSLAGNSMAVGNGFLGAARFVNHTGFAARATPWVGTVADGALIAASISDIRKNGFKTSNVLELAAYGTDLVGNGLLIGGLAPAGLALKGVSLGMQAASLGLRHKGAIGKFVGKVADTVGDKLEAARDKVEALV